MVKVSDEDRAAMAEKYPNATIETDTTGRASDGEQVEFCYPRYSNSTSALADVEDADVASFVTAALKNRFRANARNGKDADTLLFDAISSEIAKGNYSRAGDMPALLARMQARKTK